MLRYPDGDFSRMKTEWHVECLLFHDAGDVYDEISGSGRADILGTVEINTWRDERRVQIIARQVLPAGTLK